MRASTDLFDLIKSLSQAEKRYFKVYSSLSGRGKNNSVRLFEAIDKQKEYDEAKVIAKFKGEVFTKQFSVAKNYLYAQLLKSLRSFHDGKSVNSQLSALLLEVELLYQKALYDQCAKLIKKGLKLAVTFERHPYEMLFLGWHEENEHARTNLEAVSKHVAEGFQREYEVIKRFKNYREHREQTVRIWVTTRVNTLARKDERTSISDLLDLEMLQDEDYATSFVSMHQRFFALSHYHRQLGNLDQSHEVRRRHAQLFDDHPHFREEYQKSYLFILKNLGAIEFALKDYEAMRITVARVQGVEAQNERNKSLHYSVQLSLALSLWGYTGAYDENLNHIKKLEEDFDENQQGLGSSEESEIFYLLAEIHFIGGAFKQSLRWVNRYLDESRPDFLQDYTAFMRIMNMMVHFELGNVDVIESLVRSTDRYLKKSNKLYEVEGILLRFFRTQAPRNISRSEREEGFRRLRAELAGHQAVFHEYFPFIAWLDAKLERKSMQKILSEP